MREEDVVLDALISMKPIGRPKAVLCLLRIRGHAVGMQKRPFEMHPALIYSILRDPNAKYHDQCERTSSFSAR